MKRQMMNMSMASVFFFILGLFGCGGGGGNAGTVTETAGLVTELGWYYANRAPDYSTSGSTCGLKVFVYYSRAIASDEIDTFSLTSANGERWTATTSKEFGTDSTGRPYISGQFISGQNTALMPLAGIWTAQLKLKNNQISTFQRAFHEPGRSTDATHHYLYTPEEYTPPADSSLYVAALRRFPSQGYTLSYSPADGGKIVSTGLAAVRNTFLAAEPRTYNQFCWFFDADGNYLGNTIREYSTTDHSSSGIIKNGELSIIPTATVAEAGYVDLSKAKYLRFVYVDGAQYAPTSYASYDYRSISALIPVN